MGLAQFRAKGVEGKREQLGQVLRGARAICDSLQPFLAVLVVGKFTPANTKKHSLSSKGLIQERVPVMSYASYNN